MKSGLSRNKWWIASAALITVAIAVQFVTARRYEAEIVTLPVRQAAKAAQMCPWRNPNRDRRILFPHATRHEAHIAILTHQLAQLKAQLGHWPTADENPLYVYRVFNGTKPVGSIAARRVKGQYGALEIVVGTDTQGIVRGVLIQRLREPAEIEDALLKRGWLDTFRGDTIQSDWSLERRLADVSLSARPSAQAIVEGVRSLLILLNAAAQTTPTSSRKHH